MEEIIKQKLLENNLSVNLLEDNKKIPLNLVIELLEEQKEKLVNKHKDFITNLQDLIDKNIEL